jgi:hypothetical protein
MQKWAFLWMVLENETHLPEYPGKVIDHITHTNLSRHAVQEELPASSLRYRSGRSPDWLKMKNPDALAVKREAEEDWGKERWR